MAIEKTATEKMAMVNIGQQIKGIQFCVIF